MIAVMQERDKNAVPREFLETGRTGRRNAMPHILDNNDSETSVADLPSRLQKLATSDGDSSGAGPSGAHAQEKNDKDSTQNASASS